MFELSRKALAFARVFGKRVATAGNSSKKNRYHFNSSYQILILSVGVL
jgi:hypothetical protein